MKPKNQPLELLLRAAICTKTRCHEVRKLMNLRSLSGIAVLLLAFGCSAKTQSCMDHFPEGKPPVITSSNLAKQTTMLCFEGYAVMHSGISRTPIWVAEHLTAKRVDDAERLKRINRFHAEEQLPPADRSELADYVRTGYDRGHMAPNGDMPTENAQYESFSLANIIPQNPKNNQILWEGIEEVTRELARENNEVYVVTGPIFEGGSLQRINGRVLVPTFIYKAIYDPAKKQAGAYVTPNAPGMEYQTLSIADLAKRINIDVFPKLSPQIRAAKMDMPVPTPHGRRGGKNKPVEVESFERQ
ncbi:MAG TPA: DNA/RNA non-specific endonuclease [Noviherbaspirillum sp.]